LAGAAGPGPGLSENPVESTNMEHHRVLDAPRTWAAAALILVALWGVAEGGLVIEVDQSISGRAVSDLAIRRGHMVVKSGPGAARSEIALPAGALERIAVWAKRDVRGPMIISIDSVFLRDMGGDAATKAYHPPGMDPMLGDAFTWYDNYADLVARGALPKAPGVVHPLIQRAGDRSALPQGRYLALMDRSNRSNQAIWFRRLASRYTEPPAFVGQLTLRAHPATSAEGLPVRLEIESHGWMTTRRWYRGIDVPSEEDRAAAALPYLAIREDIETHWDEYRQTFPTLNELSSTIEAYAILDAVYRDNPQVWDRFIDRMTQGVEEAEAPRLAFDSGSYIRELDFPPVPSRDDWVKLCIEHLGERIETTAEAELALALLAAPLVDNVRPGPGVRPPAWRSLLRDREETWRREVARLAEKDRWLNVRFQLVEALRADPQEPGALEAAHRFFESAKGLPDGFRLRVQGLHLLRRHEEAIRGSLVQLERYSDVALESPWASLKQWTRQGMTRTQEALASLDKERNVILADFRREVADHLARVVEDDPDLFVWEQLSQNIYSVGLMGLAEEEYGRGDIPADLIRLVAEVHYHRARAAQPGMELANRHAHYRFLQYLLDRCPKDEDNLRNTIRTYRVKLAEAMQIKE
jgi:hypothetical protein